MGQVQEKTEGGWWAGTNPEFFNIGGPFATREQAIEEGRYHQGGTEPFWIVFAVVGEWTAPDAADVLERHIEDPEGLFYDGDFPGLSSTEEEATAAIKDLQGFLDDWFARNRGIFPQPTAFSSTEKLEQIDAHLADYEVRA